MFISDVHNCTTCAANYYRKNNPDENNETKLYPCHSNCSTCYGEGVDNENKCTDCLIGYYKIYNDTTKT